MLMYAALTRRPVLLVAAHPDDETIGAGGLLPYMQRVTIVHVTDGAPRNMADAHAAGFERREDYAKARRQELLNALNLAGIRADRTRELGIADQEASFAMADLARCIAQILLDERPGSVLTHAYEGGHPDHDACAFAVHSACALIATPPDILEFASYHAGRGGMEVGRFLPGEDGVLTINLSEAVRERKRRMIEAFATQRHTLKQFPIDVERFRPAPVYDFTEAPHPGRLFYENFAWGITNTEWRRMAAASLHELGIAVPL